MACAHTWKKITSISTHSGSYEIVSNIPCGKCLNCLVDKRNMYEDLCNEEALNYGAMSYVTVTYDHAHAPYVSDLHGSIRMTLVRKHYRDFLKRIRSYMDYHKIDNPLMRKDFKFLVVGEYGDGSHAPANGFSTTHRPHYHFIFFGLDYRAAAKMFRETWRAGIVKVLPVKRGCFRYVLDYMNKQLHEVDPFLTYNMNNLARPFMAHSIRFGRSLFARQWDFILSHHNCYKTKHNRLRPLPAYYTRLFHTWCYRPHEKQDKQLWIDHGYKLKHFDLRKMNDFKHELAQIREANLAYKLRSHGRANSYGFDKDLSPDDVLPNTEIDVLTDVALDGAVEYDSFVSPDFSLWLYNGSSRSYNEKFVAMQQYFSQTKDIHYVDDAGHEWCYDGQQSQFPSYKSYVSVMEDVLKYGDYVPF